MGKGTTYNRVRAANAMPSCCIPKDADLARDKESEGDCRVDVSTAHVCNAPDNRRDGEAERQRNTNDVATVARAARNQHEQKCAEKFGNQRQPELGRLCVLYARRRHRVTL